MENESGWDDKALARLREHRPTPFGYPDAVQAIAGTAAPLLAGFSVTLLLLTLDGARTMRWPDAGHLLLACASVLFLFSIHAAFYARQYFVTRHDAEVWFPDLTTSIERQRVVATEINKHLVAHGVWLGRARLTYNVGILLFLTAVAVILVPATSMSVARLAAIAVFAGGALIEATMLASHWMLEHATHQRMPRRAARAAWWIVSRDPLVIDALEDAHDS